MIEIFANEESPKALGFAMPPEWSVQESVFLSWPSNPQTWPGVFRRAEEAYASFAAAISRYERVRIICAASEFDRVNDALADANACFERIELLDIPTNDAWCRDHGPIFVKNPQTGERAVLDGGQWQEPQVDVLRGQYRGFREVHDRKSHHGLQCV